MNVAPAAIPMTLGLLLVGVLDLDKSIDHLAVLDPFDGADDLTTIGLAHVAPVHIEHSPTHTLKRDDRLVATRGHH